ncbi:MAG: glycosyltransferase [Candidatus Neomarinimicrobiota bacterium]
MSDKSPLISIITPTYNRADELKHLYRSIREQSIDLGKLEFIISDDGSTDSTKSMVEKWVEISEISIKFITQKNQGPGAARNHGMTVAEGDLFLFIDSDCEAHPDWIKTIYDEYQQNKFDAFGGPDGAKDDFSVLQKSIDFSMTSFFTTGGMRGHSEDMLAKFFPRTHNMGIKRSIYNQIGGFGGLRHGQDIEFSNRIRKSGARIKFLINAIVFHRRRTSINQFFKQVFNWGVARVNLGKIDIAMLETVHFIPSIATGMALLSFVICKVLKFSLSKYLLVMMTPLTILSLYGSITKKDIRIFPYLIIVIPAQIIGYGTGFFQAYIRRFIFNQEELVGFKKNYYK